MLLGLEVATTDTTVYQDMSVLALRDFGLDDVVVGTWLDVRGYEEPAGSGRVVATHVVRIDPADGVRLRGPFRDPAPPSFDILSVLVTTSDATRFVLEGNVRITAAEFFSQAPGELVEAWGTWSAPVLSAQRVEIKISDDDAGPVSDRPEEGGSGRGAARCPARPLTYVRPTHRIAFDTDGTRARGACRVPPCVSSSWTTPSVCARRWRRA